MSKRLLLAAALAITLCLAAMPVTAGPFFGEWSCFWRPAKYCPRGCYSPLHYWTPECYLARACLCPSYLDQYPAGPFPPVPPIFEVTKYPCQTLPPMPSAPYANPAAYYGQPTVPIIPIGKVIK